MPDFPAPLANNDAVEEAAFDGIDEFEPDHLPDPGRHLSSHEVLTHDEHVSFHRVTETIFEKRGVRDMTFGYNLAQLNLDHRHPNAGYRYAEDAETDSILWAEFTPTTEFCPQAHTLTKGSFRAWNGLSDHHDYELIRVRLSPMHQESFSVNGQLKQLERKHQPSLFE